MKGFKGIESLSLQPQASSDRSVSTAADDSETNKGDDDVTNGIENETGPELPLPIPNLFQT